MLHQQAALPMDLKRVLDEEIHSGEQVLWSCQPSLKRAVRRAVPLLFFALFWLGISSTIAVVIFRDTGAPLSAKAFIGLFLLIGLLLLSSPFWMVRGAKNTVYAITGERAIILKKGMSINIESFGPEQLDHADKRIFRDGSGDLIFDRQVSTHYSKGRRRENVKEIGFFGIPQVGQVHNLIRDLGQATA